MENLKFEIDIATNPKKVWNTMLKKETYEQWVQNAWPGSTYHGEFKQGTEISFAGKDGSGSLAKIDEVKSYKSVKATHIAVLQPGGIRDTSSDVASGWTGIKETYSLEERDGKTHLAIEINNIQKSSWAKMFADTWPTALKDLKQLCEQ